MKRILKILVGALIGIYLILVIVAYLPYETRPPRELADKEGKFINAGGHVIHYKKQGEGKPLVLVHGFGGSTYTWRHITPLLAQNYTVYSLDLPGFGLSEKPTRADYSMQGHRDLLIAFMDTLSLSSATLIGHSMGGLVAGFAAVAAPSRVDALVLIEPGFYTKGTPSFLKYMFFPLDRIMARQFYTRDMTKRFLVGSFYDKSLVTDEVLDAYMVPTRTTNAIESLAYMMTSVGSQTYEGITEKIFLPALIIWGEREAGISSPTAERIKREIQESQLVYVKESGHYVQEEKPDKLNEIIRGFLGQITGKSLEPVRLSSRPKP
jgi:pimeloyl-ACP methyl ester carboxylesterase